MSEVIEKQKGSSLARLRSAARTLFVERGYDKTRPQDIARHAGLASGTFYLHFRDKRAAFLDFAGQAQREMVEQIKMALDGVTEHHRRWQVIFEEIADFAESHPGVLRAAFVDPVVVAPDDEKAWNMYNRMGRFINLALLEGEDSEELHDDYDRELISHALCGMLRDAMIFAARKGVHRHEMIEELSRFVGRGLGLQGKG